MNDPIDLTDDTVITEELITLIKTKGIGPYVIKWLRERPRTWGALKQDLPDWAAWIIVHIPNWPIDLKGLTSHSKASVMARLPDCPIDPVDLSELSSADKTWVMIDRRDCPTDLRGMDSVDKASVICVRKRKGWPV